MEIHITIATESRSFPNLEERNAGFLIEEILGKQFNAERIGGGAGMGAIDLIFEIKAEDVSINKIRDALDIVEQRIKVELTDKLLNAATVEEGDLFAVEVNENKLVIGIVLHVSTRLREFIMLGFYDRSFSAVKEINFLQLQNLVGVPFYAHQSIVNELDWRWFGREKELLQSTTIPKLRESYSSVYYKDELVEQLTSLNESQKYPKREVKKHQAVKQFLIKHFSS